MSEHVALALSVLAEIAADTTAPALARVRAAEVLLHSAVTLPLDRPIRFTFPLADALRTDELEE